MLTKFKHCAVDLDKISFVSGNTIVFQNGESLSTIDKQFDDIIEAFTAHDENLTREPVTVSATVD